MNNRVILIFLMLWMPFLSYSYGLGFYDSTHPIAARTSYNVLGKKECRFKDRFILSFSMSVETPLEIGYVCRIKSSASGSGSIYNLFFDLRGDDYLFRFNEEGKSVLASLPRGKQKLLRDHWFDVVVDINLRSKEISLDIDGERKTFKAKSLPDVFEPEIVFGKSDYLLDVPSMSIDNVRISGDHSHIFPLNESEGNSVADSDGERIGFVENPVWLINSANRWQKEFSMSSPKRIARTYDPVARRFFFVSPDSIHIFDPGEKKLRSAVLKERCPVDLFLANCFFNPEDGRVYVYEVFPKDDSRNPLMASLDPDSLVWRIEMRRPLGMQLHHHDYLYDKEKKEHIIFGGFGNQYYSNSFLRYKPGMDRWDRVDTLCGDRIAPRYFAAVGKSPRSRNIYIFGGMGNESGDQIVGRRYFYDLHCLDMSTGKVRKLWEIPHEGVNMVPGRGMAVVGDSVFYVLCYPESRSASQLRLFEYRIADGVSRQLADSIPIKSDKITTNARLYHDVSHGKFYAVVEETDDDVASMITVYSLSDPPVSDGEFAALRSGAGNSRKWYVWVILAVVAAAGGAAFLILKRRRPADMSDGDVMEVKTDEAGEAPDTPQAAAISDVSGEQRCDSLYLFGRFTAIDSRGHDVSHMFTSRLRSIVVLLFQYGADGIDTSLLGELIWPDKDKTKVKNSRGVAINSLRKIFADFTDVSLVYEDRKFRLVYGREFYCDYVRCRELISDEKLLSAHRPEFLDILSRGRFLKDFSDPIFDDFKRKVEPTLESAVLHQIQETCVAGQYEECMRFVEIEFTIDPVNEEALSSGIRVLMQCGEEKKARRLYRKYEEEYLKTTGESLPKPFDFFR